LDGQYPITAYYVPEVGFQAELDVTSIWGESFSLTNPDPTLIGPQNHRQQVSDGPSEVSVPWFDNSPGV